MKCYAGIGNRNLDGAVCDARNQKNRSDYVSI
ncbi:hypothetical protein SAMN05720764_101405 [Fibrobacter sp. UWH5]|nr:hypothetical protein SAMN05720764_101405 [Fibrobacter sp. UWH5]